jgi:hypothetical protein
MVRKCSTHDKNSYKMELQCLNERDQLENIGIDGRKILNVSWQNM